MNRIANTPGTGRHCCTDAQTLLPRPPLKLPLGALLLENSLLPSADCTGSRQPDAVDCDWSPTRPIRPSLASKNSLRTTSTGTAKGRQQLRDFRNRSP